MGPAPEKAGRIYGRDTQTTCPDPWSIGDIGILDNNQLANGPGIRTSIGRLDITGLYPWSRCPSGHVRRYEHTRDSR